jgi:tripartite-type tricarboxylate transporter receptor subunit TctC
MKKLILAVALLFQLAANATEFTVMHGPGGVSDITTRFLSEQMGSNEYQVVNRPGAGGRIALRHMQQENTMLLATMAQVFVTNPINFKDLEHVPDRDFTVLATVATMPSVLVCNKKTNINTYKDFQNNTKPLTFGVAGYGSSEHIATEILIKKVKTPHLIVPYSLGGSSSVINLLGGHIDCMFANYPTIRSHLANVNVLLSSHDMGISITWKDVYKESFPFDSYLAVIVPTNMSKDQKDKITQDLTKAFKNKDYNKSLISLGLFPNSSIDSKMLVKARINNLSVEKFITDNNIRTGQ